MKKSLFRDIIVIAAIVLTAGFAALCMVMYLVIIPSIVDDGLRIETRHLAAIIGTRLPTDDPVALDRRVEAVSAAGNGTVATAFEKTPAGFVRRATSLLKENGTQAVGTLLDPHSSAYSQLSAGKEYTGVTTLFGRAHMSTYLPIKDKSGEVKWAVFVGVDYSHAKETTVLMHSLVWAMIGAGVLSVGILVIVLQFTLRRLLGRRIQTLQESNQQLNHLAHYDQLTDLPNRVLFTDYLRKAISQADLDGKLLGICYLDLDEFKSLNDAWGYETGNRLLQEVAHRIQTNLDATDLVARLGGDEFIVLLRHAENLPDIESRLSRLLKSIAAPFKKDSVEFNLTASIGVTVYPHDTYDADVLIRHADQAMYAAKHAGKNTFHLFDTENEQQLKERHALLSRAATAFEKNEFVLHYQPKVNMREGTVIGAEALIRWLHPERGLLQPHAFLSIIAAPELSVRLGEWVLRDALRQMNEWTARGLHLPVSVNIAGNHLQRPDFVSRLTILLAEFPLVKPQMLELEILETTAMENTESVSIIIAECSALGVTFALDDFGTGYSSLTYFRRLPTQLLKIDQSFVRDMLDEPDDFALVGGIIGLAHLFDKQVIAEGVETMQHGISLMQLGCHLAQGYGISRPMPAQDLPNWISQWRAPKEWRGL